MSKIGIGYTGKKNGVVELEGDIWFEPATGFVSKNCTTVQGSGFNTSHKWRIHQVRIPLAREETEVMRVVRNECVHIGDAGAKEGNKIRGKVEEKVKGYGQKAVLGCDKNMAVGIDLPTQFQSDRKLEVIIDDRGE